MDTDTTPEGSAHQPRQGSGWTRTPPRPLCNPFLEPAWAAWVMDPDDPRWAENQTDDEYE